MRSEEQVREQFLADTNRHTMTILKDDGLYRHVRFMRGGSSFYYYDLVTWPGHLVICGDMGDWHFARIRDMFEFFVGEKQTALTINPHYWSQKLQAGASGGSAKSRHYSHDAFRRALYEWAEGESEGWSGDMPMYPALVQEALDREVLRPETHFYEEARERLEAAEDECGPLFGDAWEWDLTDYDHSFIWCCWAIVHGISQYRKATTPVAASTTTTQEQT